LGQAAGNLGPLFEAQPRDGRFDFGNRAHVLLTYTGGGSATSRTLDPMFLNRSARPLSPKVRRRTGEGPALGFCRVGWAGGDYEEDLTALRETSAARRMGVL